MSASTGGRATSPPLDLPLVGLPSSSEDSAPPRSAPWLGRPPHALALAGPGSGVFRDEVLSPSESLRSASREVRLPFRVLRGAPPAGLRRLPRELAPTVRVRLSWGSSPLRRMRSGCHPLPRPARPIAGDEGCHALAGAAHGLSQPLGGSGHDAPLEHSYPHTLETSLAPELGGLVSCRQRPWGSPYRAFPSRGAVPPPSGLLLPCGFGLDRDSGAKTAEVSRSVSLAVPPPGRVHALASASATVRTGTRAPPIVESPVHRPRELPRTTGDLDDNPTAFGLAGSRPLRPLRSLAPLESPFTRRPDDRPELAPEPCPTAGPMLSWVSLPSWSLPHHDPGSGRPRDPPGEPGEPRKTTPAPVAEHGASILRP